MYLFSIIASFLVLYLSTYIVLRRDKLQKNLLEGFGIFILLYLSIIPFFNVIIAVLFIVALIIEFVDKGDLK